MELGRSWAWEGMRWRGHDLREPKKPARVSETRTGGSQEEQKVAKSEENKTLAS